MSALTVIAAVASVLLCIICILFGRWAFSQLTEVESLRVRRGRKLGLTTIDAAQIPQTWLGWPNSRRADK